ncbi:MAG TPA: PHP domain-containing protein [Anaerolineae bacterium]|nr:PHP domain-containing protein [Anaerolineae bacterium]
MPLIDLHSHSTASDGTLTPAALVAAAAQAGVTHLGLTDHDSMDGIAEAQSAAAELGITLVPGVELSTEHDGIISDILGYFADPAQPELARLFAATRLERVERAQRMVDALIDLGADIDLPRVAALATGGLITRPHVAQALVEAGFVGDRAEAFRRFIGQGRPAYVARVKLSPEEACRILRAAGGVPVLAHPVPPRRAFADPKGLLQLLPRLAAAGLGGLECHYPGYAARTIRWLEVLAGHNGLIPTGGSDYHGPWRPQSLLGAVRTVPADTVDRLQAARMTAAGTERRS